MKKPRARKPVAKSAGELGDEYRFDYAKAKPNKALRSLIPAMPTQVSPNKAPIRSRRKQGA